MANLDTRGFLVISLMGDEEFASVMEDMDTSDTQWSWYYLGECGKWHIYEKDPNIPHSVSSEDIERNFKENSHGLLSFSTAKYNYIIDFREMKQTNTATGKERPVKRADFSVTAFRKKAHLKKMRNVLEVNERLLFHGTSSEFVQAICLQNFDWRINGMHATVYGKGTYFARDSSYSSRYCHSNDKSVATLQPDQGKPQFKTMFLARVLVGDYVTGNPKYTRPPSKDGSLVNLYDSCVDNQWNPKIFVVFDANHIYPEYLINFC
ncbi:protein mono-ADP-ribosyltransferase PARP11-like isoform X5 [Hemitrygon akajei]|uniref:protein mono-ADP-ribosyltransferase PARP11-like isoform X5 n=1 Tax=Hemitrygon akajei TaxID=2704970 RepID=UPI003BF94214